MPAQDLARCITKSQEKDTSSLMRSEVAEIVEKYGTYGMPWIVVQRPKDGEVAWWFGSDRFHNIAWWLVQLCLIDNLQEEVIETDKLTNVIFSQARRGRIPMEWSFPGEEV